MNKIIIILLISFVLSCSKNAPEAEEGTKAYYDGKFQLAHSIWVPLAVLGSAEAQWGIGILYDSGNYGEQSTDKAIEWFTKSANQNYAPAQFGLAVILSSTDKDTNNLPKAYQLLLSSANQGYVPAQYFTGRFLEKGLGTDKNIEKAKNWYVKAAENNYPQAQKAILRLNAANLANELDQHTREYEEKNSQEK